MDELLYNHALVQVNASNDTEDDQQHLHHPHHSGKNYWALILGLVCIIVVIGNVLVIVSVFKEKVLQNITNYFIVSLAVADLLVAGCVMPFSVYVLVNWGMWDMPKMVCDFYIASDVICSTSSIFNLVAISIDRYLAVTSPIKYSQHKDKTARAYISIVVCWLLSIGIGSPIMLGANPLPSNEEDTDEFNGTTTLQPVDEDSLLASSPLVGHNETVSSNGTQVEEFVCAFYNPDFIIYSSLGSFYIPCVIMVFLYIRIFSTLHARARIRKPKATSLRVNLKQKIRIQGEKNGNSQDVLTKNGKLEVPSSKSPNGSVEDEEDESTKANPKSNDLTQVVANPLGHSADDHHHLPAVAQPLLPSPTTLKPNKADKASGPDTSLYERSRKYREQVDLLATTKSPSNLEVNHLAVSHSTTPSNDDGSMLSHNRTASPNATASGNQFVMRDLVAETTKAGKTKSKLAPSTATASVAAAAANKHDENGLESQQLSEPNAEPKKILSLMSLSKLKRRRNGEEQRRKSAKNAAMAKERHRKEKPSARKERKATQTLAIVLGVFLVCWVPFFTCNIINAICIKFELGWWPGDTAFMVTTWLGYINSCVNPLIYTIFNPEFRKAFKKLLHIK